MDRISIQQVGPIESAAFDLRRVNLFIGPQASGKSTLAKAAYWMMSVDHEIISTTSAWVRGQGLENELSERLKAKFRAFFPPSERKHEQLSWSREGELTLAIKRTHGKIELEIGAKLSDLLGELSSFLSEKGAEASISLEDELALDRILRKKIAARLGTNASSQFIPAGRTVLAWNAGKSSSGIYRDFLFDRFGTLVNRLKKIYASGIPQRLQEIFESNGKGSLQANQLKWIQKLAFNILQGDYGFSPEGDHLLLPGGQQIPLDQASSGQQESLYILLPLIELTLSATPSFLAIEEPEAHLFPEAQKAMVELLALMAHAADNQLLITTHSPYLLTAFNNLLYAEQVGRRLPSSVNKLVPSGMWLRYEELGAYFVEKGKIRSILDPDLKQIKAETIDQASDLINSTYDQLLNLDHESVP